jgi:transposase
VSFGLIKASFVPEQEMQELRSLLRARKQLTREQTSHVQRIQKTLEEANIKLDSVISDIVGLSGRRMIEAMINGVRDPWKLAELGCTFITGNTVTLNTVKAGVNYRFLGWPF